MYLRRGMAYGCGRTVITASSSALPVVTSGPDAADIAVEAGCVRTDVGIEVCVGAPTALTLCLAGLTLDCMPCVYKL